MNRIAIIGAGPGGLTLARLLHVKGIQTTVFEKDPSAEFRGAAGGSLDLHEESGQLAIRQAGLWAQFQKHARYEGQDFILRNRFNELLFEIKGVETGRPEIDRKELRKILLESVPKESIKWDHNLKKVDVENGELQFSNGTTEKGYDLVVGADGAWSKVRSLLCYLPPFYAGITGVEIQVNNIDTEYPDLSTQYGNGSHFSFGDEDGRVILAQRQGDRSLKAYAVMRKPENWIKDCGIDFSDSNAVKKHLLEKEFAEWSPELTRLIKAANDKMSPRALYMLPVGIKWPHKKGYTLLGDAAHLMTPFAGEGVNAAMWDALELANAIIASPKDLDSASFEYEQKMFPRSEKFQKLTWDSLMSRFDRNGSKMLLARFESHLAKMKGQTQSNSVAPSEPKRD